MPASYTVFLQIVGFFSMLTFIETHVFFFTVNPYSDDRFKNHEDDECHYAAVEQSSSDCDELCPQLTGIPVQESFARLVDGRISKYARQDCADGAADAVD